MERHSWNLAFCIIPIVIDCSKLNNTFPSVSVEDLERNDGSQEKPYFMSKSLMRIYKKTNEPVTVEENVGLEINALAGAWPV